MNHTKFIHLRVQSSFSLLESTLTVNALVDNAVKYDMPTIALTDKNNTFAALEFSIKACNKGVKPIHGIITNIKYKDNNFYECILLAKDNKGFQNLLVLSSFINIKNEKSDIKYISLEDLSKYNEGLICILSYTNGVVKNDVVNILLDIFGDRFYLEIFRHGLDQEKFIEDKYINFALSNNLPLVATHKVLFEDITQYDSHDVMLCIDQKQKKRNTHRKVSHNQYYFKSESEMVNLFSDISSALQNSVNIAHRCNFAVEKKDIVFPTIAKDEKKVLVELSHKGLEHRLKIKFDTDSKTKDKQKIREMYYKRLDYELDVICKMNFAGYFLIVSDFINWSKDNGIIVGPGRGSGAGSIVAWAMKITDLDPIRFRLLFERFLNPERVSMPDFDIDFCQERRDEVIEYVREKYGDEKVAHIITFGTMQAKGVIKDVARVMDLPYRYADYLSELIPFNPVDPVKLNQAVEEVQELNQAFKGEGIYSKELMIDSDVEEINKKMQEVLQVALQLEGLQKNISTHAAGVVIANQDLMNLIPLYKDHDTGTILTQYSMKYTELAGLIKFDFLGLQTLTLISKCSELLKRDGINVDIEKLSLDDVKTYQMMAKAYTAGVFQFESAGIKNALKQIKPDCIEDIIALTSLYRPGPIENIPVYAACKNKKQKPDYLHPILEPILKETYGVIIYQEQVIEIAKVFAGYTSGAADILRRAMGKKIKSEMDEQKSLFIKGARNNGIDEQKAEEIFTLVAKFAGYGFNRSHGASYALISYITAYLKANYTIHFLVSCLNLDIQNNDKVCTFIDEAKNNDIDVIPVDINISSGIFKISGKSIVFGLHAIKGIASPIGDLIEEERVKNGNYKDIVDFMERMPEKTINKRIIEKLIKSGCFDKLHSNRYQLIESVPNLLVHANDFHQSSRTKQMSLWSVSTSDVLEQVNNDYTFQEKSDQEFEVMGLFMYYHPLNAYKNTLINNNIVNSKHIQYISNGNHQLQIAGVIYKKVIRMSKKGKYITLHLSDLEGLFEASLFRDDLMKSHADELTIPSTVVLSCDVFKDDYGVRLNISNIFDIKSFAKFKKKVITIKDEDHLKSTMDSLALKRSEDGYLGDQFKVKLLVPFLKKFNVEIDLNDTFKDLDD